MPTCVPKLSGRIQAYMLDLADKPDAVVARIHALLAENEDAYARLPPAATQDVLQFITRCASMWFRTLGSGALPSASEWNVLEEVGRRRVL